MVMSILCSWRFEYQSTIDKLAPISDYPLIPGEISIALKKNKSQMFYFIRFLDSKEVAVINKDRPDDILVGEDTIEDLLTVSLSLIHKTSWSYKATKVLVQDVILSIGQIEHGTSTSTKHGVIELTGTDNTLLEVGNSLLGPEFVQQSINYSNNSPSLGTAARAKQWFALITSLSA